MSHIVRVNAGKKGVSLPDGKTYDGQVDVTLTDNQFARISARAFTSGLLVDMGVVAVPSTGVTSDQLTATATTASTALAAETTRAQAAEASNASATTAEATTRAAAITTEATARAAETTRAQAAEAAETLATATVWTPSTTYAANQWVITPGGYLAQAKATFTSGATYSASTWTEFIPGAELAYAENITGTNVTAAANSTSDVTGLTIAVPACPRPVYMTVSMLVATSVANALMTFSIVEIANGTDTPIVRNRIVSGHATAGSFIALEFTTRLAASTARTRNFKVQAQSNSGTGVVTVYSPTRSGTSWWDCYVKAVCA